MTGKDYFNKLTPEEQAMFKKNMKYRFEPHMKKTFRIFLSFLDSAFIWERSEQGKEFWTKISFKYEEKNNN